MLSMGIKNNKVHTEWIAYKNKVLMCESKFSNKYSERSDVEKFILENFYSLAVVQRILNYLLMKLFRLTGNMYIIIYSYKDEGIST